MGPSPIPIPPLDPAPTTGELVGPFPAGPALTSARKQYMLDPPDSAHADTDMSEERIPFYLLANPPVGPWTTRLPVMTLHTDGWE